MKPKGILFKAEMVRAILDDRKTQTRGVINPQPKVIAEKAEDFWAPYPTGTVLYVKETWRTWRSLDDLNPSLLPQCADIEYRADNLTPHPASEFSDTWRSPLFMQARMARIWLRVTDVRVERLQDISEADAIAEGVEIAIPGSTWYRDYTEQGVNPDKDPYYGLSACAYDSYGSLWESINGPGSWDANPYVFAYTFERIERPAD